MAPKGTHGRFGNTTRAEADRTWLRPTRSHPSTPKYVQVLSVTGSTTNINALPDMPVPVPVCRENEI